MNIGKTFKRVIMGIIFLLIVISFAFFGIDRSLFQSGGNTTVVSVGSHHIDMAEYKREFDSARDQQQQQSGQPITTEQLVAQGADVALLNQLAVRESIDIILTRLGVRAGVDMISEQIRGITQFFDPVTGQFNRDAYKGALAEVGLTPKEFEDNLGKQVAVDQLYSAMTAGVRAPTTMAAFQSMFQQMKRDVEIAYVTPASLGEFPLPTDAQLTAYLNELGDEVRLPELRVMTIARFSVDDVMPNVKVDDAEVQKLFEFRRDQAATPETRTLVQIPAKDQATAQTIAARLAKGDDPAAVASAVGSTVVRLDNKPQSALPDAKMAAAAFKLKQGETSGPIQGDLGLSVVKVLAITAGVTPNMDEMRSQIVQEARQRAAEQLISEAADKYDAARQQGASLADAAKAAGAKVFTTPQTAANGGNATGAQVPGLSQRVLQEAFQLDAGEESDLVSESAGQYFVVRVDEVIPPQMPKLQDVHKAVLDRWMERELTTRLDARTAELLAKAKTGTLAAAAQATGAQYERISGLTLAAAQQQVDKYGAPMLQKVFQSKPGDFFSGRAPAPANQPVAPIRGFVAVVAAVHPGDTDAVTREAQSQAPQMGQLLAQEVEGQVLRAASQMVKARTYPDRARTALGLDPLPTAANPAPSGSTAAKK